MRIRFDQGPAGRGTRFQRPSQVIRADVLDSLEQASAVSLAKARQVIDEQGDTLLK